MDEPLLTTRQVDALLLLAEHGPATRATYTAPVVEESTGRVVDVVVHGTMADRLVATGHLMHFGANADGAQVYALTDLGHRVAERARPGVTHRRRVAVEAAAAAMAVHRSSCGPDASLSGVDDTALDDPAKVWRCDSCSITGTSEQLL